MPTTTFHDQRTLDGRAVTLSATVSMDEPDAVPTDGVSEASEIDAGEPEDLRIPEEGVFAWIGDGDGSRALRLVNLNADNPSFMGALRQRIRQDPQQFDLLLTEAVADAERLEQLLAVAAAYLPPQPKEVAVSLDLRLARNGEVHVNGHDNGHARPEREPLRVAVTGPRDR